MIYVLGHNYAYTDVDSIVSSIVLADMLNQKGCPAEPVIVNPKAIGPTHRVKLMIAAENADICDECVLLCMSILIEETLKRLHQLEQRDENQEEAVKQKGMGEYS